MDIDLAKILHVSVLVIVAVECILLVWHIRSGGRQVDKIESTSEKILQETKTVEQNLSSVGEKMGNVIARVDALERRDLISALTQNVQMARRSIAHYTYTFHTPKEEAPMKHFIDALQSCSSQLLEQDLEPGSNAPVRFLAPPHDDNFDRLHLRYKAGAAIRITRSINQSDLRFQIADQKEIVLTIGSNSLPSSRGFVITSFALANILLNHFDSKWADAEPYEDYVSKAIIETCSSAEIRTQPPEAQIEYVMERLDLNDRDFIRAVLESASGDASSQSVPSRLSDNSSIMTNSDHDSLNTLE